MKRSHAKDVYVLFALFQNEFLLKGNSILTDDKSILTTTTIQNCLDYYVEDFKDGGDSFDEKVKEQFKDADLPTRLVFAHAEWLWGYAVSDISKRRKKEVTKRTTQLSDKELKNDVYPDGFGSGGMYHKNNKYREIVFVLQMIQYLRKNISEAKIKTIEEINRQIEEICLYKNYDQAPTDIVLSDGFKGALPKGAIAVCNTLTYLSFPDKYERINSNNHKNKILNSFSGLLTDSEQNDQSTNLDAKLLLIRQELTKLTNNKGLDFYEGDFAKAWDYSSNKDSFSEMQGMTYKKAIILYGPPGTSKTHTANQLASTFIINTYLKKKENITEYFTNSTDITKGRIHHLQLHANYNYEDFVAGIQLKDNSTKPERGKLFSIIDEALKDKSNDPSDDIPHVLILDEINRIDLSRLFGEVFSALENRDKPVELGVGNLTISIPRNLYVIGTMNEIDFSLERIDFALRRRFLWFFYGFERDTLSEMIGKKNELLSTKLKDAEIERFVANAESLNSAIKQMPELGEQYQIGHTFFSEIVDIYKSYIDMKQSYRLKNQLYRQQGSAQVLWAISIEPIIRAFLGNMDSNAQSDEIKKLKGIYDREL